MKKLINIYILRNTFSVNPPTLITLCRNKPNSQFLSYPDSLKDIEVIPVVFRTGNPDAFSLV